MPNVKELTQLSGHPAMDDLLHVIDVDAAGTQDRKWPMLAVVQWMASIGMRAVKVEAGAPTVNDDETAGHMPGNTWLDTTGPVLYMCVDATAGAADWRVVVDWS